MPGPILWGPNNTSNNLQTNLTQAGRYIGAGAALPWTTATAYVAGDITVYSGTAYRCLTSHTAAATFEADMASSYWKLLNFAPTTKNYIQVGSGFESNTVEGWTAAKSSSMTNNFPSSVGTGGNPFSSSNGGTTATTAAAPTVTSSNPLAGTYSLNFATNSSGATAGDMYISQAYSIDAEDQAKVLQFKFAYKLVSDTNSLTNFSGTSANTFGVAIYDVVNNVWIQPAGVFNFVQKTGVGYATGTFQTSYNMTKFQIAVYVPTATAATTISLYLDDFFVGPQITQVGSPITDYEAFTPTINWSTNYTCTGYWKRIGDSAEFLVKIALSGAPLSNSELIVNVPFGWQIDTTKLLTTVAGTAPTYGDGIGYDQSTTNLYLFRVQYWSATSVKVFYQSSSTGQESAVTTAVPPTWGNSDTIIVRYCVPIVGWSSSLSLSNSTDTRVIACKYTRASGGPYNSGFTTTIAGVTLVTDTAGSLNTTSGIYTVPVTGYYKTSACLASTSTNFTTANNRYVSARIGGTYGTVLNTVSIWANATTYLQIGGSTTNFYKAGDTITLDIENQSGSAITLSNSPNENWFTIERVSGPAVIAASETVALRYTNTSQPSVANNNTSNYLGAWTKDYDTLNFGSALTNTTASGNASATIPVSGKYLIIFSSLWNYGVAPTGNGYVDVQMFVNTSLVSIIGAITATTSQSQYLWVNGSETYNFKAGDVVAFKVENSGTGSTYTMNASANWNHLSIIRVGN